MRQLNRLFQRFKPSVEEDIQTERLAYTLAILFPLILLLQIFLTIIGLTIESMPASRTWTVLLFLLMLPIYFSAFHLYLKRNYTQSSRMLIIVGWIGLTTAVFIWRGIQSPIFGIYPLLFLIAAILLNRRDVFILLIITILTSFAIYWAEIAGLFIPREPPAPRLILTYEIIKMSIVTVTMTLIVHRLRLIFTSFNQTNQQNQKIQSQLKEANASLENQSFILQTIIDNLPGRVAYTDKEGLIVFMSSSYAEVGIDPIKSIGTPLVDTLSPAQFQILKKHIDTVLSGQIANWEDSIPLLDESQEIVVNATYIPHIVHGEVVGYITLARDVTDIRKSEAAIRHGQKLHSLGILAGGIAHDFNNLLVGILGQNSIARAKMEKAHPARRHLDKAIDASEKAKTLIQQMLAYSGRGQFQTCQIDLNELIQTNLRLFEFSIPKHVEIHTRFADDLPSVDGDTGQLQQLIMNLIINAAQSITAREGAIYLSTGMKQITPKGDASFWQFTGNPLKPGHYVKVKVKDNGQGMSHETISQIFDPFFTTKERGSGLGLAAVLGIIRGHKGGLQVKSELEKGTSFTFLLPVAETAVSRLDKLDDEHQIQLPGAEHQRGMILIIDDETAVCATAADILSIAGWQTIEAYSGAQGVALYQEQYQHICLVLLDLSMPGLNGEETFHELCKINPDVSVILSSGYDHAEATKNLRGKHGIIGFLQKPYSYDDLIKIVHSSTTNS